MNSANNSPEQNRQKSELEKFAQNFISLVDNRKKRIALKLLDSKPARYLKYIQEKYPSYLNSAKLQM